MLQAQQHFPRHRGSPLDTMICFVSRTRRIYNGKKVSSCSVCSECDMQRVLLHATINISSLCRKMTGRVLFVFTSNDKLVNTTTQTGWYLPEAAHPYYALRDRGIQVDFVSEKGGRPPVTRRLLKRQPVIRSARGSVQDTKILPACNFPND